MVQEVHRGVGRAGGAGQHLPQLVQALAERASLHRTYAGSVERGERNISLDNIYTLADALGVPASQLLR